MFPSPTWRLRGAGSAWAWPNRYSFEALGQALGLDQLAGALPAMRAYGDTFSGTVAYRWLVLAGFAALFALATVQVLRRQGSAASRQR